MYSTICRCAFCSRTWSNQRMSHQNLLGGPPETLLPDDPAPREMLAGSASPAEVARAHPESALAWAVLAEEALAAGREVEAYAYARTGYHRSLDTLRRNGWKGHGPGARAAGARSGGGPCC